MSLGEARNAEAAPAAPTQTVASEAVRTSVPHPKCSHCGVRASNGCKRGLCDRCEDRFEDMAWDARRELDQEMWS